MLKLFMPQSYGVKNRPLRPTEKAYPYLFQTCGFRTVDDIRAEVESQPDWDKVQTTDETRAIQRETAAKFGFSAPFSKEQKALGTWLVSSRAGRNISTYAWGLYADRRQTAKQYA